MSTFTTSLRSEVLAFRITGFPLENDLRNLDRVYAAAAHEAVVFYCARILEAIIKQAHQQFFGEKSASSGKKKPTLADMEQQLHDYNLLQQSRYYWTKGLRLLGNEARHELRRIRKKEADCALIFLEFVLLWYFCDFPSGLRLPSIFKGQGPAPSGDLLQNLAWTLDSSRLSPDRLKVIFGAQEAEYLKLFAENFAVPALLIEIFIALGDHASAERLTGSLAASGYRPRGALRNRFIQLKGLLFSREERLEDALALLEPEYIRLKNDPQARVEDELSGILAGVYKRLWKRDGKADFLARSHEAYQSGWSNSRNSNTYLGINAASTALWLNNRTESSKIAREVRGILERRRRMIQQNTEGRYDLNYWDMATLAEANLLAGQFNVAEKLYCAAFTKFSSEIDSIATTKNQLNQLVQTLKTSPLSLP